MKYGRLALSTIVSLTLLSGYALAQTSASSSLKLTSPAFAANSSIPAKYTCEGVGQSPPLSWTGVPGGTRSYVLIIEDPDAPNGPYIHWLMYNLPTEVKNLPAGVAQFPKTIHGALNGDNSGGGVGYIGPCPPAGTPHHYVFHLMALNTMLDLNSGATREEVEKAASGHVLGSAKLVGLFGH